jgi:hypothetical protein
VKQFSNLFLSGIIISTTVAVLGGCGDDEVVPASPEQDAATKADKAPPVVVEWYPTPKHQHRPQYTLQPSTQFPSQSGHAQVSPQPAQQQFSWGGYVLQPVPQAWMVPAAPATGYGITGAPAPRDAYAPVPVWGQTAQPTQQQQADNSKQQGGQTMQTWQVSPGLPAYGGYQYGNPGVYGAQQGTVAPGGYR